VNEFWVVYAPLDERYSPASGLAGVAQLLVGAEDEENLWCHFEEFDVNW
jgi:hypothetical protein